METAQPDRTVPIQQRWKHMLNKSDMQKYDTITSPTVENKDKTPSKSVQMYLNQNMTSFTYLEGTEESSEEISSISRIYSEQTNSQTFTIELNTKLSMHFKAPSVTLAQDWIYGLKTLISNQQLTHKGVERRDEWLREIFQALSTADHHELKYSDIFKYVLNAKENFVSPAFFKQKLKEYLKSKKLKYREDDGFPRLQNFVEFYKHIFDRKEMVNLFRRVASDGTFITTSDLQYFLTEQQYQKNVTHDHCKEIIVTNEVTQAGKENLQLNIDGFTHFMQKEKLFNPKHDGVYQDMSQPLTHYYIASSHNTYLCGKQLSGDSSAEAYSDVLKKGCRCVELDCWDGDDGEPIVYHGHTLTTKILFKDIIKAINDSAFMTSSYPVIVSLENHCSLDVQKKMASYLVEILADKMYTIPVDKSRSEFPSPEFFKHKILIRGKVGSMDDEEDSNDSKPKSDNLKMEKKEEENKKEEREKKVVSSQGGEDVNMAKEHPESSSQTRERKISSTTKRKTIAKELSNLINYTSNAKFVSFEESDRSGKYWQSSSFVEGDMEYHADKNAEAFIRFNRRQLSRIYPGGLRIDSSNYNPIKPWSIGSQIVALNHQTDDEGMALYDGKFRQNGRAGYILKPQFLRDPSIKFNPNVTKPRAGSKVLKMTIISGQQLPDQPNSSWSVVKDEPDPYVQVQIQGVPSDEYTFTTKALCDNSFNPIWNQSFETNVLVPELAMVAFSVYDKDVGFDDFIGQAVLPFESMQQGYRHVPLMDKEGNT
ncbi:1-phosphatidylinositol 4,5-bisphosphate phosphodiesterase delta-4 [Exaiptasia diaphana]|nr:1-phosphatidylinositol 4,5-bisphosphate phosphodiesterase delta-4 [Exaiptasia diaphana]